MKNKRLLLILTLVLLGWTSEGITAGLIADIHVDSALSDNCTLGNYSIVNQNCSGSDGDAYTTIQEGLDASQPGDIVQVRAGLYYEQVNLRFNGEPDNRITLQNYPGETPVLEGTRVLTGWVQCAADDPHLTVQGTVNPHYASIYRTSLEALPPSQNPNLEHLIVLYENGDFLLPAQDPNQGLIIQNQMLFIPITEESVGLTEHLIDSDYLTQPDDYWAGANVWVWLHAQNNTIHSHRIASSSQAQHSITFETPLAAPLAFSGYTHPDAYSIYNHPHLLDQPGEYFYTPEPDGEGKYWLYVWPRDTAHLADNIGINDKQMGFFIRQNFANYVTIDGFEIRGFSGNWTRKGGVVAPHGFSHTGLHVKNCHIHHNYGYGISLYQGTDDRIESNTIDMNFGAGLQGLNHTNLIIRHNTIRNHEGTNVSLRENERMEIVGNHIGGFLGTHGNGMAIYDECNDVLVADNIIAIERNVPLTFNTMGNLVLVNNVFYSGDSTRIIASWSMGTGYHLTLNNLILGADTHSSTYFRTAGDKVFRNNIVDGGTLTGEGTPESTYNMYTAFTWDQPDLHPTEIDAREVHKDELFVDYSGLDFHLREASPARDAGVSITDVLQAYELETLFPTYNFYSDLEGNARPVTGTWDLGPHQFVPHLQLRGTPADQTIHLDWTVNATLPPTTTWTLAYAGPPGDEPSPITGLPAPTRAYTLTGLTHYQWYTVTLNAMVDATPILTDTVRVMPTDISVYLPLITRL
ncbi:MAG: hypothetical protein GVY30_00520 [Chloroflexi bacterium]|jgi:hypothetical protein|nr:hypothetical protein [Chloroflexota bacterium]